MLLQVVANAVAIHQRHSTTVGDRVAAARWLCRPDGPLAGIDPEQLLQPNGCRVDVQGLIG